MISKSTSQSQSANANNEPIAQEAMLSAPKPAREEGKDPDIIEDLAKNKTETNGDSQDTQNVTNDAPMEEKSRIEIMQERQKLIEEDNKRKKALLAKAIADR